MKRIALIFVAVLSTNLFFSQTIPKAYYDMIKVADSLYRAKDYRNSAARYSEAFKINGWKGLINDRYNAACAWALAGVPDSAFFQLDRIVTRANYSNYGHITTDPDLESLRGDQRWKPLLEQIRQNKEKAEANLNKPLVATLDSIFRDDQEDRLQIKAIEKKYGRQSNEMKLHWKIIGRKDSVNLVKVKAILDKHGWLGPNVIGNQGNSTLFLVIQHADHATQEKYLPMMRDAVKKGNAYASSLALLEDRTALGRGEKQIYGSQIGRDQVSGQYYVLPLTDPDNVDRRRAEVGLQPIQDYISNWGIKWDVEEYKKKLPEYEAKEKR